MRVTDAMLRSSGLATIQTAMRQVATAQEQLSSGKRITKISDDPIAAQSVMRSRLQSNQVNQYQRNILAARARHTVEETVLNELSSIIEDARQIGLTEGSGTRNTASRQAAHTLVEGMLNHVVALGNSRVGNDYIFAGRNVNQPAFDMTGAYQGDTQLWEVEIDRGFRHLPNNTGQRIFVDTDLIPALSDLAQELANDNPAGILAATERLRTTYNDMQTLLADVGGRSQVTDSTEYLHKSAESHNILFRSDLEDVEIAEAMSNLASRQAALNGALIALREGLSLDIASLLR